MLDMDKADRIERPTPWGADGGVKRLWCGRADRGSGARERAGERAPIPRFLSTSLTAWMGIRAPPQASILVGQAKLVLRWTVASLL